MSTIEPTWLSDVWREDGPDVVELDARLGAASSAGTDAR
jgi:hypothetical protein